MENFSILKQVNVFWIFKLSLYLQLIFFCEIFDTRKSSFMQKQNQAVAMFLEQLLCFPHDLKIRVAPHK